MANPFGLRSLVLYLGYFSPCLICNNVFFFSDPIGPADFTGLFSFKMLSAVMSAFFCWPIECVWNEIRLYELLILLLFTSLVFLSPAPNTQGKANIFKCGKLDANHLVGRWMEPELCLYSVEKRTEKYRSPII